MTPSIALAERIRAKTETGTDYAVAKALGVSQSNLKQVLAGKRGLGIEACFRAAEMLGQDAKEIIAEIELHRATPEKKAFWEKRLPRILPAVVICGLTAGVTYITGPARDQGLTTVSHAIHYAKRLRALLARVLGRTAFGLGCFAT